MIKSSMLCIDPGVIMGWAYFPDGKKYPKTCGVIKPKVRGDNFYLRVHSIIAQLANVIVDCSPTLIAIEWPSYFGSVGGIATAGHGDLVKLAFTVGKMAQIGEAYGAAFIPVPVVNWKGQLKKNVVIKRIKKTIPKAFLEKLDPDSHSWDAIGIGLFVRGLF